TSRAGRPSSRLTAVNVASAAPCTRASDDVPPVASLQPSPVAYDASRHATLTRGSTLPFPPYRAGEARTPHTVRILGPMKSRQESRNRRAESPASGRAKAMPRPRGYRARKGQPERIKRAAAWLASTISRPVVAATPLAAPSALATQTTSAPDFMGPSSVKSEADEPPASWIRPRTLRASAIASAAGAAVTTRARSGVAPCSRASAAFAARVTASRPPEAHPRPISSIEAEGPLSVVVMPRRGMHQGCQSVNAGKHWDYGRIAGLRVSVRHTPS